MTDSPPLAEGPLGMRLLAFERVPEDTEFTDAPVAYALVALFHGESLLLVHVRGRDCWELPGGSIDPGETPRQAAVRELWEETGQLIGPDQLRFVGFARTSLAGRGVLRGALYRATTSARRPFEPTEEIAALHWGDPGRLPAGAPLLQTVDVYLAALAQD